MDGFTQLKVTVSEDGATWVVDFDHGKANEMGTAELVEIERLTTALESDPRAFALITTSHRRTSKGTPLFVAGANVTERADWDRATVQSHVAWQRQVLARLRRAPVFHVVVVGGIALGWGTEYLLAADYRIAAPSAVFGLPETGLGIVPGAGGTAELWAEIGVGNALRLGMTGERIGPEEALRIGLVHEVAPSLPQGLERAHALCAHVARRSPTANALFKRAVLDAVGQDAAARARIEATAYNACVDAGEAAIGRSHFDTVTAGGRPPWGPRTEQ